MTTKRKPVPITSMGPDGPRRKFHEEVEDLSVKLTEAQIRDERARAVGLMQEIDKRRAELAASSALERAAIKELEEKRKASIAAAQSGERVDPIVVETWLEPDGEVTRIRVDTMDIISTRKASQAERQELLEFGGAS